MRWLAKIPFIILGLLILLAVGRIFFFNAESNRGSVETPSSESQEEGMMADPRTDGETDEHSEASGEVPISTPTPTTSTTKQATPEDCERECEGFSALPEEQSYCLSFCGLNQEGYQGKDCETLTGSSRDACFKEQAIRERNAETCARIGERSLRRACEARIAEELFD